jgi:ferredoxin
MPKIKFVAEFHAIDARSGRTIREVALENGIYVNREFFRGVNCGGRGLCGTCRVWVHQSSANATSTPNLRERTHGMGRGRRLACQTKVLSDIEVTTMPGGDDRLDAGRVIDEPPRSEDPPAQDAPRKAADKPLKADATDAKAAAKDAKAEPTAPKTADVP